MQALKNADREGYFAQEKIIREQGGLPPYGRLAGIIFSGVDALEVERFAKTVASQVVATEDVRVLGPAPAPLAVINGRHRWRLLVKASRDVDLQAFLRQWLGEVKPRGSLHMSIDVDPYGFL